MQQKTVSVAFSLQQILDAVMAARLVSQSVEGLHFNNPEDERNAISSVIAVLELVGLQGQNLQRCLRGELNPLAVLNPGNTAPLESMIDWKDIRLEASHPRLASIEDFETIPKKRNRK